MQNMLRPLVEAAGYRVIDEAGRGKADVSSRRRATEVPQGAAAARSVYAPSPKPPGQEGFQHLSL